MLSISWFNEQFSKGNSASKLTTIFAIKANGEIFNLCFLFSRSLSSINNVTSNSSCCVTWGILIHDVWRLLSAVFWNLLSLTSSTDPHFEKSNLGWENWNWSLAELRLVLTNSCKSSFWILPLGPVGLIADSWIPNSLASFLTAGPA